MEQEWFPLHSVSYPQPSGFGTTCVEFDPHVELVWSANMSGTVTSYIASTMQKYSSFQGHMSEVRQLIVDRHGVVTLAQGELRMTSREGLRHATFQNDRIADLQCMVQAQSNPATFYVGGLQDTMAIVHAVRGRILKEEYVDVGVAVMKRSRLLCCGGVDGSIVLRDPSSLRVEQKIAAHNGTISDIDVADNYLVSCGFSNRHGQYMIDPYVQIFDMRTFRALPPIQFPTGPSLVKFMPIFSSYLTVTSQAGQFLVLDVNTPNAAAQRYPHQVDISQGEMLTSFDISSTGNTLVFADSAGVVHQWANTTNHSVNVNSRDLVFSDPVPEYSDVNVNTFDDGPVPNFPLAPTSQMLLSSWPQGLQQVKRKLPVTISQELLNNVKFIDFVGSAPNPGTRLRNQVENVVTPPLKKKAGFRQKYEREDSYPHPNSVPRHFRKNEMKYSRFGLEDFDFARYNRTGLGTLEPFMGNAYVNALLQVFFFISPLKKVLKAHLCKKEFCLACELSFLFEMLDLSKGKNCQASNFVRAFRTIPQAACLGLLLTGEEKKVDYCSLIQSFNRFLLQQIHLDVNRDDHGRDIPNSKIGKMVIDLLQIRFNSINRCQCGLEIKRKADAMVIDLVYPDSQGSNSNNDNNDNKKVSFETLLTNSISKEQTITRAWCETCQKYQPTVQKRYATGLPFLLSINCAVDTAEHLNLWHHDNTKDDTEPYWLPAGLRCKIDGEKLDVKSIDIENIDWAEEDNSNSRITVFYELVSVTSFISDEKYGGNLVSEVKVPKEICDSEWFVFNDFAVTKLEIGEPFQINTSWKTPCVLYYKQISPPSTVVSGSAGASDTKQDGGVTKENKNNNKRKNKNSNNGKGDANGNGNGNGPRKQMVEEDFDLPKAVYPESCLYEDSRVTSAECPITFTRVTKQNIPKCGELVAIDAEFVALDLEEASIRSDGTKSTIKPSQLSLARVSVVHGEGPFCGLAFIDDYICTSEQIVDYLTQYSGIHPGDLDPSVSTKYLVTLKSTYQKLRYLVDAGVVFVGHGLKKDFRIINIIVPTNQVIDTVELFYLPKQRLISLRFLAWYLLGDDIQTSNHDSIEDSCAALRLYRKYLILKHENKLEKTLRDLYAAGRKYKWKAPHWIT